MQNETILNTYEQVVPMFDDSCTKPVNTKVTHTIETVAKVPKLGVMLVGLGGNNGSTFTAGILANKLKQSWETKTGIVHPNFHGSFTQCATAHVGYKHSEKSNKLEDVFKPVKEIMPMVNPIDFEISGWDINNANMFDACKRAQVLEPSLVNALKEQLEAIVPLQSVVN